MAEFEIINIEPRQSSFTVEIELPDRTRRKFGYPMGEGWEQIQGETHKFVKDISWKLDKEAESIKANISSIDNIRKTLKNQKYSIAKEEPKLKTQPHPKQKQTEN